MVVMPYSQHIYYNQFNPLFTIVMNIGYRQTERLSERVFGTGRKREQVLEWISYKGLKSIQDVMQCQ